MRCSLLAARCSLLAARCSLLAARCSLLAALGATFALPLAVVAAAGPIAEVFTQDPATREVITRYVHLTCPCFFLYTVMVVLHGCPTGRGRTVVPIRWLAGAVHSGVITCLHAGPDSRTGPVLRRPGRQRQPRPDTGEPRLDTRQRPQRGTR
ncbi:MATE family efflux transporter [Streptomyces sp. NBC_00669]|uniref:MATE family efflux transporter n=1 Tax=Streptomyces sp. NBC_00669 TaxID=2976011 RepID=UPI002E348493|nr:MATE family efflux transporter [Streptomyces sp. NBC_00669]